MLSGGFPATLAGAAVLAAETVPGYESLLLSVILSLRVTVIGENVTSTLLLYNKRPPNVFITSKNKKKTLTDLWLMSEDGPSKQLTCHFFVFCSCYLLEK